MLSFSTNLSKTDLISDIVSAQARLTSSVFTSSVAELHLHCYNDTVSARILACQIFFVA